MKPTTCVSYSSISLWYGHTLYSCLLSLNNLCLFVPQVFPDVTILFSDVVKFNEICIHITPMQVVDMLNEIYIVFDTLSEKHNVYKVTPRKWDSPMYRRLIDTVN